MSMGQTNAVVKFDEGRDEISGGKFPSHLHAGKSNGGGGGMDDVLKRLGAVESTVLEVRAEVTGIAKVLPHLATRADLKSEIGGVRAELGALRTDLGTIVGTLPLLATKADVAGSDSIRQRRPRPPRRLV
jgi:hypothetical protein